MSVFSSFSFTKPKVVSLLSPSVFHPSKQHRKIAKKAIRKPTFTFWVLKGSLARLQSRLDWIFVQFFHVAYCVFAKWWLVGLVRHPRNSWDCGWSDPQTFLGRFFGPTFGSKQQDVYYFRNLICNIWGFPKTEVPQNGWFHNGKPY